MNERPAQRPFDNSPFLILSGADLRLQRAKLAGEVGGERSRSGRVEEPALSLPKGRQASAVLRDGPNGPPQPPAARRTAEAPEPSGQVTHHKGRCKPVGRDHNKRGRVIAFGSKPVGCCFSFPGNGEGGARRAPEGAISGSRTPSVPAPQPSLRWLRKLASSRSTFPVPGKDFAPRIGNNFQMRSP